MTHIPKQISIKSSNLQTEGNHMDYNLYVWARWAFMTRTNKKQKGEVCLYWTLTGINRSEEWDPLVRLHTLKKTP